MSTAWDRDGEGDGRSSHLGYWVDGVTTKSGDNSDIAWLRTDAGRQAKLEFARRLAQTVERQPGSALAGQDHLVSAVPSPFRDHAPALHPVAEHGTDWASPYHATASTAPGSRVAIAMATPLDHRAEHRVAPLAGLLLASFLSLPVWIALLLYLR